MERRGAVKQKQTVSRTIRQRLIGSEFDKTAMLLRPCATACIKCYTVYT